MTRGMTRVIAVPFHDGRLEFDRGRGPGELLAAAGIEDAETIPPPDPESNFVSESNSSAPQPPQR